MSIGIFDTNSEFLNWPSSQHYPLLYEVILFYVSRHLSKWCSSIFAQDEVFPRLLKNLDGPYLHYMHKIRYVSNVEVISTVATFQIIHISFRPYFRTSQKFNFYTVPKWLPNAICLKITTLLFIYFMVFKLICQQFFLI